MVGSFRTGVNPEPLAATVVVGQNAGAMTSKRTLIRGGQLYDHDGDVHKPAVADILIEDDTIVAIGPDLASHPVHEVVDASGRLILPGLINAHYHSHDVLCRGLFEDLPLEMWLLYTLPMGADRSKEEGRARTLVGALECLRCGITTVQDMLGLVPLTDEQTDVGIAAYREAGIRVVFSPMVWDIPPIESPNSSYSRVMRSHARQRTTPWIAGIGPSSTMRRERPCAWS